MHDRFALNANILFNVYKNAKGVIKLVVQIYISLCQSPSLAIPTNTCKSYMFVSALSAPTPICSVSRLISNILQDTHWVATLFLLLIPLPRPAPLPGLFHLKQIRPKDYSYIKSISPPSTHTRTLVRRSLDFARQLPRAGKNMCLLVFLIRNLRAAAPHFRPTQCNYNAILTPLPTRSNVFAAPFLRYSRLATMQFPPDFSISLCIQEGGGA